MSKARSLTLLDFKLRKVQLPKGANIRAYGSDRRVVKVKLREMSELHKTKIISTLKLICSKLRQPNEISLNEEAIEVAANFAVFVETRNKEIGAYTSFNRERPFIVLNEEVFSLDECELCVTLLHELLHMLETMGCIEAPELTNADKLTDSRKEAVHDLLCYSLLGLGVPSDHWAFENYPEFRALIVDVIGDRH